MVACLNQGGENPGLEIKLKILLVCIQQELRTSQIIQLLSILGFRMKLWHMRGTQIKEELKWV